jgi:hypothetical protein
MASLIPKWVKKEVTEAWRLQGLYCILLKDTHTPTASQQFVADVIAHEITSSGNYTAGGEGLAIATLASQPDGDNYYLDSATDLEVGPFFTGTFRYAVIFTKNLGSSIADYKIRAQIDFGSNQTVTNGTSTIEWNALGIIYVS